MYLSTVTQHVKKTKLLKYTLMEAIYNYNKQLNDKLYYDSEVQLPIKRNTRR